MTQIDSLLPTLSNDTHVSHFYPDRVDDIVVSEGHQQPSLAADGNFHSTESNVTFNTNQVYQENEASNTNADSKHPAPSTKAPMPLGAPSGGPGTHISNTGGPSTPIVKKASIYNVLLVNSLKQLFRLSVPERSVQVLSNQLLPSQLLVLLVPKSPPLPLCQRQQLPL
jgi:hypothetical protein